MASAAPGASTARRIARALAGDETATTKGGAAAANAGASGVDGARTIPSVRRTGTTAAVGRTTASAAAGRGRVLADAGAPVIKTGVETETGIATGDGPGTGTETVTVVKTETETVTKIDEEAETATATATVTDATIANLRALHPLRFRPRRWALPKSPRR
jgi:hypothetical protein